jgi:putative endonuclease
VYLSFRPERSEVEESLTFRDKLMYKEHNYSVYILASNTRVLYIGVTNNLFRRVAEHKMGVVEGFSKKYNCHNLVYAESYRDINEAISRETQLKKWRREKKEWIINKDNPHWKDLSETFS